MQPSLIGQTLRDGEYLVRDVLGQGGMATVYRAYSRSLETYVALKVLAPRLASNFELRDRFHEEARLLSRLFHPNLLTVHYFGEEGDTVYIAMRLVNGGTLRDRMTALGGSLDLVSAARIVHGVADALQVAHDARIVHLDVKPSNVLLGRADWPLLADTGIAEVIQPAAAGGRRPISGTPAYMSPEQCRGDAVDGRSDQYSLAVMAYELLTGRVPFTGSTAEALLRQHIEDAPPRPRQFNPGLPTPVEEILLRGLAKDPADRFPGIADFGRALSDAVEATRGLSLETKASLADAAPNVAGALALLLLGPLLLLALPAGALLAGSVPLAWPFQLALAAGVTALLLGVRWHAVGLLARAANAMVDAVERGTARPRSEAVRRSVVGAAEGVVNLLYVVGFYRWLGIPLLGLLGKAVDPAVIRVFGLGLLGIVMFATIGVAIGVSRSAGLGASAVILALAWALSGALASSDLGVTNVAGVVSGLRLLVGVGIVAALVARRRPTGEFVTGAAVAALGRLMLDAQPDLPAEATAGNRSRLGLVTVGILDLLYLLLAYVLLRTPLIEELQLVMPPFLAAALVTGIACLVWLALAIRLQLLAGVFGLLLGLLLGAPLLLSLPLLDVRVVPDAPTIARTLIAWIVGVGCLLLLVGVRGRLNDFGRAGLGARLDRGLLGTHATQGEDAYHRRHSAFARLVGALIDVALLVVAYWVIGAPLVAAAVRSTGQAWPATVAIAALLAAIVGVLGLAVLQTRETFAETGGPTWRARASALAALLLLLLPVVTVASAVAPTALATPAAAGALELQAARTPLLIVDWDFWTPWTPGQDQATYALALSCTDGSRIGEFRETVQPASGTVMPAGPVGQLGLTAVACDNWPVEYAARRRAAGLGDAASLSWSTLDISATLHPDDSLDVVETHRVSFTAGSHDHLAFAVGAPAADLTGLRVSEGRTEYPVQSREANEQYWVAWSFPPVAAPAEHTYTVAYHLNAAVRPTSPSHVGVDWRVLPPDPLEPIWSTTVRLKVPDTVAADSIQLQASGAPVQSGLLADPLAWFTVSAPIAGQALDTRVEFPAAAPALAPMPVPTVTPTPRPTNTPTPPVASTVTPTPTNTPSASATPTSTPAPVVDTPAPEAAAPEAATVTATPTVTPPAATPTPSPGATEQSQEAHVDDTPTPEPGPTSTPTETPTPLPIDGVTPTPAPADTPMPPTPSPPPTLFATSTSTPTSVDTVEPTHTPTPTRTPQLPTSTSTPQPPTSTPTLPPTSTPLPTATPPPPTPTPTPSPTSTPTVPPTPTATPTRGITQAKTPTPTPTLILLF